MCVAYDIDGVETKTYPAIAKVLSKAVPIYEELEGWSEEIPPPSSVTGFEVLPGPLRKYLDFIEKATGSKVSVVSVGKLPLAGCHATSPSLGKADRARPQRSYWTGA